MIHCYSEFRAYALIRQYFLLSYSYKFWTNLDIQGANFHVQGENL